MSLPPTMTQMSWSELRIFPNQMRCTHCRNHSLAGSVGRSKSQKAHEVQDQDEVLPGQPIEQPLEPPNIDIGPPADRLGIISSLRMPPSGNPKSPSLPSSVASLSIDNESDGGGDA